MDRMTFLMAIRPDREAEFDRRHRVVWPDPLAELPVAGTQSSPLWKEWIWRAINSISQRSLLLLNGKRP